MTKPHAVYVCQECGYVSPRWVGKCPECNEWNSFVEELRLPEKISLAKDSASSVFSLSPIPITQVSAPHFQRISGGISELDRVLGGGIVPGAVTLVGGDPGIGKSTLLTQMAYMLSRSNAESSLHNAEPLRVLYVSGEESVYQIRLRSERLGALSDQFLVVNETDLPTILSHIDHLKPSLVIIDSIQTTCDPSLESAPGTVSQIRDCAAAFTRLAKADGPPVFLIGHVTKEGALAGPRILEHMVDTVLYFEGDRHQSYRILRAVKNRFGSTNEIGIFEMQEDGLAEVENPSAMLLAERAPDSSGSSIVATVEGTRPLLVEVQALVARSPLANPRRAATGTDYNRLSMLLAVLEKRFGLKLAEQDVFVNVVGGIRLVEPAADLAITIAIISSFREQPVASDIVLIGETGLGGEIRTVSHLEQRLRESARLGFKRACVPSHGSSKLPSNLGIHITPVSSILEASRIALLPAVN
jgi:DNA repair protein RadA/Sms